MMATGSGRLRYAPTPSTRRHTLAFPEMRQRVNAIRRMQVYASRAGGREATGSPEALSLHSCARQKPEWQQSRTHRQRRLVVPRRAFERWRQFGSWSCRKVLASAGGRFAAGVGQAGIDAVALREVGCVYGYVDASQL